MKPNRRQGKLPEKLVEMRGESPIMTTPDKADEVKAIMVREFQRFGLNPTIKLEAY